MNMEDKNCKHSESRVIDKQPELSELLLPPWDVLPYHYHLREDDALFVHNVDNCPIGLESLILLEKVFVIQTGSRFLASWRNKKYVVLNNQGDEILKVEEITKYCQGLCEKYPFSLEIYDVPKQKIMTLDIITGIFGVGGQMDISHTTPVKSRLGFIEQVSSCQDPAFSIFNSNYRDIFRVEGPEGGNCWGLASTCDFNVLSVKRNSLVGKLRRNDPQAKTELGLVAEPRLGNRNTSNSSTTTSINNWIIEFPRDLDPIAKVSLLSSVFLLVRE